MSCCLYVPSMVLLRRANDTKVAFMQCGSSGYLSFFFTDCLMSRWLINYTPQATIIRLLTINCANAFLTERILFFAGGFDDPRLLLPGWISIASVSCLFSYLSSRFHCYPPTTLSLD